jgi:hypothetical protein
VTTVGAEHIKGNIDWLAPAEDQRLELPWTLLIEDQVSRRCDE